MMIYLNNAATSYPKPQRVIDAHVAAIRGVPVDEGRGTYTPTGEGIADVCRRNVGAVLGVKRHDRIFFTAGATDSINRLIGGLRLDGVPVVATQTEHNSVLRAIFNHTATKNAVSIVACDGKGRVSADIVEAYLASLSIGEGGTSTQKDGNVRGLLIVNHCSNVTGTVQDIAALCDVAHRHGYAFMVDAAQSAGTMPIEADDIGADIVVFTGHKGLFGAQGTGGYYIREGLPLRPTVFGGTGRNSKRIVYDGDFEYEPGTQNLPAIAALNAGAEHIISRGMANITAEEGRKVSRMREALSQKSAITLYGEPSQEGGTIVSFNIKGITPDDIGYILQNAYGITVRTGMHCAPLIHKALGTYEHGTVRASVTHLTPDKHIEAFIRAVSDIAESAASH